MKDDKHEDEHRKFTLHDWSNKLSKEKNPARFQWSRHWRDWWIENSKTNFGFEFQCIMSS